MKASEKPPKKKTAEREKLPGSPPAGERRDPEHRNPKPAAEGTDPDRSLKPSEEEVISNLKDPVTNQDEQDKITNAGEGDIPIANK